MVRLCTCVCGRPCIRGLRVRVTDILWMLAEGVPHDEILRDFPYLEPGRHQGRFGTRGGPALKRSAWAGHSPGLLPRGSHSRH